jgi:3-methyl-2-oxobutanoate hydroxymethyltransferase
MGGYVVQGRDEDTARKLLDDAVALENAGCFALVLEGVPLELAKAITARLHIPTIGIGAGKHCDGQVLVCYDLLGFNPDFKPKFVKRYTDGFGMVKAAASKFFEEVRAVSFPDEDHSFRSTTMRLVASNPDVVTSEREDKEKSGIYGVPV